MCDKKIFFLDLVGIISGVVFRGVFEEWFKVIMNDVEVEEGWVVLFIDELYMFFNFGKVEGLMDVGNMFKFVLVWGLMIVGVMIFDEYRCSIEKDSVLFCCF